MNGYDEVAAIVALVVRRNPKWAVPVSADNQCSIASLQPLKDLVDGDVIGVVRWLVGPRGDLSRAVPGAFHADAHLTVVVGVRWLISRADSGIRRHRTLEFTRLSQPLRTIGNFIIRLAMNRAEPRRLLGRR